MLIRNNSCFYHTTAKIKEFESQGYKVIYKHSINDVIGNLSTLNLLGYKLMFYVKNDPDIFKNEKLWKSLPDNLFLEFDNLDKRTKFYTTFKAIIEDVTAKQDKKVITTLNVEGLDKLYKLCESDLDKTLLEYDKVTALGITIEKAITNDYLIFDEAPNVFFVVDMLLKRNINCLKYTEFITDNIFAILTLMFNNYKNIIISKCNGHNLNGFQKKSVYEIIPFYTESEIKKYISLVYEIENDIKSGRLSQVYAGKFLIMKLLDKCFTP